MTRLGPSLAVLALVVTGWAAVAAPARATYGARLAADEPQYVLSALSLWEDFDLDISDELAAERWRDFHRALLPEQTEPLADGRRVSPHDPLLPVLLAVPVGLAGWLGAKLALASMAGGLAAATAWTAIRRFRVTPAVALIVVLAGAVTAPLVAYGGQIYPEVPAALAVVGAVAAVTGPLDARGRALLAVSTLALPWLGIKYLPVAVALLGIGVLVLWRRGDRQPATTLMLGAAVATGLWIGAHVAVYSGWTAYSAGDHFVGGDLTVGGTDPDRLGRSVRLLGLLVDRGFGLVAWAPMWLLAVPALAALGRRRPPGWEALVVPTAAAWAVAVWIALTMHGWWWPGRQVVVVLPLVLIVLAWWVDDAMARGRAARVRWVTALAAVGVITWAWLVAEVLTHRRTLIVDFEATGNPLVRMGHRLLPDFRAPTAATPWLAAGWAFALLALAWWGWRGARRDQVSVPDGSGGRESVATTSPPTTRARPTSAESPSTGSTT